ncbi:MAG: PfkB domain protein [Parcubacteria group bacterium GW2011_GWA2_47_16]|nr:MAG: PfkB domain protein [Parcubacteria group bacterium GW2011_GWA2_47_16]
MKKRALVVGSVAFDVIFDIHGKIKDSIAIEGGKAGKQNLMFTAKIKQQHYGGAGANIAYGLGLLGVKPILFSSVGKDFKPDFHKHLKSHGVDVRVHTENKNWTATFYGMSDDAREQIGVWQPNAHDLLDTVSITDTVDKKTLKNVTVALIHGKPSIPLKHMGDIRKILGRNVTIIFDPGQNMSLYSKDVFEKCLALSDIYIVNDIELKQSLTILKCDVKDIFKFGIKSIIETKGEAGSVIYENGKTTSIPARKVSKVVEATGAGDAYRAGLIYGLLEGADLAAACRIGSYLGAKNVETRGGQAYMVSREEL